MRNQALLAALAALALQSCATPQPAPREALLYLHQVGNSCQAQLGSRRFELPAEEARLRRSLTRLQGKARKIDLQVDPRGDWSRCVGPAAYIAQSLGLRIGFISEPSPN
jgi:hypothetical protein